MDGVLKKQKKQAIFSISQNKPGQHQVHFVVMRHICDMIKGNESNVANIEFEL